jgi:hypothetical protein
MGFFKRLFSGDDDDDKQEDDASNYECGYCGHPLYDGCT